MQVVAVRCDANGSVDLADLEAKCAQHAQRLAAVMITYPSTYGVFEAGVTRLCQIVHAAGGRVYIDGANLNALVGLAAPGRFRGDVSHLNLHKTFCIPHGGGPGVGPVCVVRDLVPYLPGHGQPEAPVGAVSAAPLGNAAVLPINRSQPPPGRATQIRGSPVSCERHVNQQIPLHFRIDSAQRHLCKPCPKS